MDGNQAYAALEWPFDVHGNGGYHSMSISRPWPKGACFFARAQRQRKALTPFMLAKGVEVGEPS